LLINWFGRYASAVDHLAVQNLAQGAPLGGGSTLHPKDESFCDFNSVVSFFKLMVPCIMIQC